MKKIKRTGFSLVEVLISIAVVSIGILGALATIAFGLDVSDHGEKSTNALNYNRRAIEMMINGYRPVVGTGGQMPGSLIAPFNTTAPASTTAGSLTGTWHRLYDTSPNWFTLTDWAPASNVAEQNKFIAESKNYEMDVHTEVTPGGVGAAKNIVHIVVQTRWRDKRAWRVVRTDATCAGL